jgi:thiamine pyrophosphokinase
MSTCGPPEDQLPLVVVPGGLGGRLDHTLQSLNTALIFHSRLRLVFWTEENCAEVLPPGHHCLELNRDMEGPHCGLLPLQGTARARTEGLQWELSPTPELEMAWGGLLSTSNRVRGSTLEVESEHPLLWTIERHADLSAAATGTPT